MSLFCFELNSNVLYVALATRSRLYVSRFNTINLSNARALSSLKDNTHCHCHQFTFIIVSGATYLDVVQHNKRMMDSAGTTESKYQKHFITTRAVLSHGFL